MPKQSLESPPSQRLPHFPDNSSKKKKKILFTHSFHVTFTFHQQISKTDFSSQSKQGQKERVPLPSIDATPTSLGTLGTVLICKKVVQWNKSLHNLWSISVHTVLNNQQKLESELGHQNKDLHSYEEIANTICMHQSSFCWSHLDYNTAVDAVDKMKKQINQGNFWKYMFREN